MVIRKSVAKVVSEYPILCCFYTVPAFCTCSPNPLVALTSGPVLTVPSCPRLCTHSYGLAWLGSGTYLRDHGWAGTLAAGPRAACPSALVLVVGNLHYTEEVRVSRGSQQQPLPWGYLHQTSLDLRPQSPYPTTPLAQGSRAGSWPQAWDQKGWGSGAWAGALRRGLREKQVADRGRAALLPGVRSAAHQSWAGVHLT